MVKVDEYARIRRAHRDGLSIRELGPTFHHSRRKIREILARPSRSPTGGPSRRRRSSIRSTPSSTPSSPPTSEAPPKQRHTAMQVFRRLQRRARLPRRLRPGPPLRRQAAPRPPRDLHPAGPRPGPARSRPTSATSTSISPTAAGRCRCWSSTWAYSNCPFALALPTERTEAILHGMVEAFAFFGCVPREVWWDNPTTVATQIFQGRERRLHPRYAALASHYTFDAAVLHAGPRQREAARREPRARPAAAVGHAGAARRRPGAS